MFYRDFFSDFFKNLVRKKLRLECDINLKPLKNLCKQDFISSIR